MEEPIICQQQETQRALIGQTRLRGFTDEADEYAIGEKRQTRL